MASSHRRKVRRYLLGATQKATRLWWIGQVTVRVMDVSRRKSTRPVREKAQHGAEKSFPYTGKKVDGLRNPVPANQPKAQSSRKVNHIGRKFIWAVVASNSLRKDCKKLAKVIHTSTLGDQGRRRKSLLTHCRAKWQRLHLRAELLGIPYQAAFHRTFTSYLDIETSLGNTRETWEDILDGLPRPVDPSREDITHEYGKARGGRIVTRRSSPDGNILPVRRACRACGYFGLGPHAWNACRTGSSPKRDGGRRQSRGSRTSSGSGSRSRFASLF